jgi:hypothetical protein
MSGTRTMPDPAAAAAESWKRTEDRSARTAPARAASAAARRRRLVGQINDPEVVAWLAACPPIGDQQRAAVAALLRPRPSSVDVPA